MKLFLISPQEGFAQAIETMISVNLGSNNYIKLQKRTSPIWIAAADRFTTSADMAKMLGMTTDEKTGAANAGLVVEIGTYYGLDSAELWQKLDAWTKR